MKYFVTGLQKHQSELYNVVDTVFGEACKSIDFPDTYVLSVEFLSDKEYKETCKEIADTSQTLLGRILESIDSTHKEAADASEESALLATAKNEVHVLRLPINLKVAKPNNAESFAYTVAYEAACIKLVNIESHAKDVSRKVLLGNVLDVALAYLATKYINLLDNKDKINADTQSAADVLISEIIIGNDSRIVNNILKSSSTFPKYLGMKIALNEDIQSNVVDRLQRENTINTNIRKKLFGDTCTVDNAVIKRAETRIKKLTELKELMGAEIINMCDNGQYSADMAEKLNTDFSNYVAELQK